MKAVQRDDRSLNPAVKTFFAAGCMVSAVCIILTALSMKTLHDINTDFVKYFIRFTYQVGILFPLSVFFVFCGAFCQLALPLRKKVLWIAGIFLANSVLGGIPMPKGSSIYFGFAGTIIFIGITMSFLSSNIKNIVLSPQNHLAAAIARLVAYMFFGMATVTFCAYGVAESLPYYPSEAIFSAWMRAKFPFMYMITNYLLLGWSLLYVSNRYQHIGSYNKAEGIDERK